MKKRDKSKRYVMNLPLEVMPKRKQKFLYNITKKELEKAIRDVFKTEWKFASMPPINSHWHDKALDVSRPLTPSESFRMEIMDLSDPRKGFTTMKLPCGTTVQIQNDPLYDEIEQFNSSLLKEQEVIKGPKKKLKI